VTLISASIALNAGTIGAAPQAGFQVSFTPGAADDAGHFMGGTEMRVLAAHAGRLYAGNGYWEDRPGAEGVQGSEIFVLDGLGERWRVDQAFDERLPDGRRRDLAVSSSSSLLPEGAGIAVSPRSPVSE
jgi:hypothetical protein